MGSDLLTTIKRIRGDYSEEAPPRINPLLAASILASSQLREQGIMEKAATEHAKAESEKSVTIKGDRVTIKNAPTRDYLGEAELEIADSAAATHALLQDYGIHTKDPNDPRLLDGVSGFRENYQARREAGDNPIFSAIKGLLTQGASKIGLTSPRRLAEGVRTRRAARDIEAAKALLPLEGARRSEERMDREEGRLSAAEKERTRKERLAQEAITRTLISQAELNRYDSDDEMLEDLAKQSQFDVLPDSLRAFAVRKRKQDTKKYAEKKFNELRGQNKAHLSREELQTLSEGYMGAKPTAEQWSILLADQRGEREALVNQRKAQDRADNRIAMAIANTNKEKPRKLTAFDAANATPRSLLAAKGDTAFEQTSVAQAIDNRVGSLEQDLKSLDAQLAANRNAHAKLKKYTETPQGRFDKDALKRIIEHEALGANLVIRHKAINEDLSVLRGGETAAAAAETIGPNARVLIDEQLKTAKMLGKSISEGDIIAHLKKKGVDLTQ